MKLKTTNKNKKTTEFSKMSVDNFFETVNSDSDNEISDEEDVVLPKKSKKLVKTKQKHLEVKEDEKIVNKKMKNKKQKNVEVNNDKSVEKKKKSKNMETADVVAENTVVEKKKKKKQKVEAEEDEVEENNTIVKKKKKSKKQTKENGFNGIENNDNSDEDGIENNVEDHKDNLDKLKEIDPEFYSFLEKNDKKLLNFNLDDDFIDNDDDGASDVKAKDKKMKKNKKKEIMESDDEDDYDDDEKFHKPTDELEVASDESDFVASDADSDVEDDPNKPKLITLKLLKEWEIELKSDNPTTDIIRTVLSAFNSALVSISQEKTKTNNELRVDGAAIFNGVLQLCVLYLESAIRRFLGITPKSSREPHTMKKWGKIKGLLRSYLTDLTKLIENVSSSNIITVILKHLHQMLPFVISFSFISKPILKRLIILWSTADETVRILSFLCILRLTRNQQQTVLGNVLKTMYFAYVRNSKFVNINSLPSINFMRRSLIEIFCLDLNISYKHCFLYIRQLAIHLRNSVTLQKKDSIGVICNWQYVNSLRLWSDLLSVTYNQKQLQPLIYPLISIITGVIRLLPKAKYFPIRFHCCKILVKLSTETNIFIPVLPYILETLNSNVFNEQHKKVAMKPKPFTCILRCTEIDLTENAFRDEVIDNVYGLTLEYMSNESYNITFTDLSIFCLQMLKKYIKLTKNTNYARKLKQLVDKIDENNKYLEKERKKVKFSLKDVPLIESWEQTIKNNGTPLLTYYNNWLKAHTMKERRQATNSDDIADYNLPLLKRRLPTDNKKKNDDGPVTLFPSDDEDDDDDEYNFEVKSNKKQKMNNVDEKKKNKKNKKKVIVEEEKEDVDVDEDEIVEKDYHDCDDVDIIKDLDLDDWD